MDRKTTLIEPPSKPAEVGNQTSLEQLTIRGVSLTNLSGLPREQVFNWLPHRLLEISKAAFFPDATPIKNGIPTGCAIETFDPKWRKYAAFDAGCGMRVLQSELSWQDFSNDSWDKLAGVLMDRQYNRGLRTRATGILGTGNHFVDAFVSHSDMKVWFIIHSGSTTEGSSLKRLTRMPDLCQLGYCGCAVEMAIRLRYDIECGAGLLQRIFYFSLLREIKFMELCQYYGRGQTPKSCSCYLHRQSDQAPQPNIPNRIGEIFNAITTRTPPREACRNSIKEI